MDDKILQILLEGESLSTAQMAQIMGVSQGEVDAALVRLKERNILLGWRPVIHPDALEQGAVRAVIEVRITPERDGGFNRIADRISRFDEVESCYLMSGGYDLMVIIHGKSLQSVASFVSTKLSTIGGVLSTATHFVLRAYKEQGFFLGEPSSSPDKPMVSP